MTKQRRNRIWVVPGTLALLLFVAGVSRAQQVEQVPPPASGPMGDVFENNSNSPVYEDQFSESCDSANHSTPYVEGFNAALCEKVEKENSSQECAPIGGGETFLAGKSANFCIYCQQPPEGITGPGIVIPISGGGTVKAANNSPNNYGYTCGANLADPQCYLSCFGKFQYTPPPGTAQMGQDGTPPKVGPPPPPKPLVGHITYDAPDPCHPAGIELYYVCDYPNLPRPAGCTCSKTPAPQAATPPKPQPKTASTASQPPNEGTYLQGIVDGIGTCLQGLQANFIGLTAGAGYFAKGDFVHAAELWGVQPGQSAVLNNLTAPFKSLYNDMTTPQVGVVNIVSDYQRGVAGGKNLCKYWLIPAAKQAIKSALNGGPQTTGGAPSKASVPQIPGPSGKPAQLPGGNGGKPPQLPGGSGSSGTSPPPQFSGGPLLPAVGSQPPAVLPNAGQVPSTSSDPGTYAPTVPPSGAPADAVAGGGDGLSPETPLWGGPLQLDLDRDPKALAGKYVKLPDGRVIQLGGFLGKGGFADVYKYGDLAIKFSKKEETYGYGPDSLAGQDQGADRLQGTGVAIPKVYEYQAGGNGLPASFVTGNANTEFPGFKEITPKEFQAMPAAGQAALLKAMTGLTNAIAGKGYVLGDPNPGNIRFKSVTGGGYQAMLLDTDMVMTIPEIQAAAKSPGASPAAFVHGGVVNWGLELANQPKFDLNTATAQSLTDVLNEGRANRLSGATNAPEAAVIK